eukprot:366375-Chlamydomonas_euryale.AAC.5
MPHTSSPPAKIHNAATLYAVPSILYAVPETSGLTGQQLHNAYLHRVTGMGRRPDGTLYPTAEMCTAARVPQLMHILNAAQLTCLGHVARMPDESTVKHLLFAEGLVGLAGVAGRPRTTWQNRAVAALRPVLTSRLAGWGWYGVAQDRAQWRSLCDSAQPAA